MDDRVRRALVANLYARPIAQVSGNLIGLGCAAVTAWASDIRALDFLAAALAGATALRVTINIALPRLAARATRAAERAYGIATFLYAALVGLLAAAANLLNAPPAVQVLTACYAVGFGIGGAGRSAGRPQIAIGQLVFATLPLAAALAIRGDPASLATAGFIVLTIPAVCSTVAHVFRLLHRSIDAAETSGQLAERMQQLANTDVVTGALNRAGLDQQLRERVAALAPGQHLALLWFDLDHFKQVNDTLGHQAGDRVLAQVGKRLGEQAPDNAAVARYGGDEFIVACSIAGRREALLLAQRLHEHVTAPFRLNGAAPTDRAESGAAGAPMRVGTSLGIALLPDDGAEIAAVLQAADLALYNAKLNGRNQAVCYDPAMTRSMAVRREIEDELRAAMLREELSIYFQPIIELATGRIRAFEALVRWFHPVKGEITPDQFIPVAEETGMIVSLGNWVTAQAARVAATWPDDVMLTVNLSPAQIKAPGGALGILTALRSAGLPPQRLELEITEPVLLERNGGTDAFVAGLGEAGVRFALDDFGTGYSSLSHLSKYRFSRIKIDRSFVSGSDAGSRGDATIRAVAEMAGALGMELTAEGIETIEQARQMAMLGCTLGQGWHFSRAVPDYLAAMLIAQERDSPAAVRLAS
ncbi:MAG: EAL domain-containing protein [Sphingomonadales bacterium]|nr:EAL domain-containing protein [Sphingomonadales bacterium]MBU3993966.1 EAL domain-containing protein [Alphaproteobacteria bacterium]